MDYKTLKRANYIKSDIYVIEKLKERQDKKHWIAFNIPDDKCMNISEEFQDALMEFVSNYKIKIEKEFEEL